MYKNHLNRPEAYKLWKRTIQQVCEEFGFSIEYSDLYRLVVIDTLSLKAWPISDSDFCDPLLADERAKEAYIKAQQKGEDAYNSIVT